MLIILIKRISKGSNKEIKNFLSIIQYTGLKNLVRSRKTKLIKHSEQNKNTSTYLT